MGTMKKVYFLICIACAFLLGFVTCFHVTRRAHERKTATTDETKTVTDSMKTVHPTPSEVRDAGFVTVPVRLELKAPAEPTDLPEGKILVYVPESLKTGARQRLRVPETSVSGTEKHDTAFSDTLRAVVPLTQKVYRDSLYTAYVSGYRPRLDSITVRQRTVTVRQTVTQVQPTTKRSRFTFGLTVGAGCGLFTRQPDIFVGAGVTMSLYK